MVHEPESNPWSIDRLHVENTAYFPSAADVTPKAILMRGRDNWLARFTSGNHAVNDSRDVKEEVQALFARWLRMQNFCVLMGAGASVYATNFLNAKLLENASCLLKGRPSDKTLTEVRRFASDVSKPDLQIEDFLSQLQGLYSIFNNPESSLDKLPRPVLFPQCDGEQDFSSLRILLADLERAIAVTCNVTLPPSSLMPDVGDHSESAYVTPHENFLSKLMARDPQDGRARIFTSNYDTLIEQAMDRLGILYSDGFTGTVGRRFNAGAYDLDYYFPGEIGEGRVRRYHKVVQLFKLHGSINWRRCPQPDALNPYGIRYESGALPSTDQVLKGTVTLDEVFPSNEGLGILPTASKYGLSLTMPFAHMFRSFGNALLQPQTVLFVIGYGGSDDHINQIIHDALVNPGFTCVIVDPFPSKWAQRLLRADYCQRVYCVAGPWGFFDVFSSHLLPNLEALATDLDIARTLKELRSANSDSPLPQEAPHASKEPESI